jgi:hypothetical protein
MNNTLDHVISSPFPFITDEKKLELLKEANKSLNIEKSTKNKLVFVYTPPKVGSTSVVSSLRLFCSHFVDVIHIHDEEMMKVLGHINGVTVKEIILYNKFLGKDVYVIDIYRSPIERKMSTFFEKVGSYHFNNTDQKMNQYDIGKIITRFNNIFEYLAIGDHFLDQYQLTTPAVFDWKRKYVLVKQHDIMYIKLRLKDAAIWGNILSKIFGVKIAVVKDYETTNKPIKYLFNQFKDTYKIPINFLNKIMECKYLNYYFSPNEKKKYYDEWIKKSATEYVGYTNNEYRLYQSISLENMHINYVQSAHYMDEGCICAACGAKRREIAAKVMRGLPVLERIIHKKMAMYVMKQKEKQLHELSRALQGERGFNDSTFGPFNPSFRGDF